MPVKRPLRPKKKDVKKVVKKNAKKQTGKGGSSNAVNDERKEMEKEYTRLKNLFDGMPVNSPLPLDEQRYLKNMSFTQLRAEIQWLKGQTGNGNNAVLEPSKTDLHTFTYEKRRLMAKLKHISKELYEPMPANYRNFTIQQLQHTIDSLLARRQAWSDATPGPNKIPRELKLQKIANRSGDSFIIPFGETKERNLVKYEVLRPWDWLKQMVRR